MTVLQIAIAAYGGIVAGKGEKVNIGGWHLLSSTSLLWAFHGDKDTAVPVERSRMMIEALKKAGGEPKYTEYAGVGHDSWSATYANPELYDWLFTQLRREEVDSKDLKN